MNLFGKYIFIILLCQNLYSQNLKGVAIYSCQTNFEFKTSNEQEDNLLTKIFKSDENHLDFQLFFYNDESLFFSKQKLTKNPKRVNLLNINSGVVGRLYINYKNKEYLQQKEKFGERFLVSGKLTPQDWIVYNKPYKIGKYECYRAELKQKKSKKNKTIAWFTPDISLNMGPKGFYGLPGLIVMLKDDIFLYKLKEIKLTDQIKISKPKKGRRVSEKQYDSIYRKMIELRDLQDRRGN